MKTLGDAVKNTLLTPNEARKRENLPPLAGGDALYLQQQNYSLEALSRRDAREDPFASAGKNSFIASCLTAHLTVIRQSVKQSMMR